MAKMNINIKTEKETKIIRLEDISEEAVLHLSIRMLDFPNGNHSSLRLYKEVSDKPVEKKTEEPKKSKKLPLKGNGASEGFTMADILGLNDGNKVETPEETKVEDKTVKWYNDEPSNNTPNTKQLENGMLLYRAHVNCPYCGETHNMRHTRATNWFIKCFACDGKIAQRPAVEGNENPNLMEPVMDENGAYFYADEPFEEESDVDDNDTGRGTEHRSEGKEPDSEPVQSDD